MSRLAWRVKFRLAVCLLLLLPSLSYALSAQEWLSLPMDGQKLYVRSLMDWWVWEYKRATDQYDKTGKNLEMSIGILYGRCIADMKFKELAILYSVTQRLEQQPQHRKTSAALVIAHTLLGMCRSNFENPPVPPEMLH